MARSIRRSKAWELERLSSGIGAHVRGEAEHARNAEQNLRLLGWRQEPSERGPGKRCRLFEPTSRVQQDRDLGDERATPRVTASCQFECTLRQVGGGSRIRGAQRLCRSEKDVDRLRIAGLGACRKLLCDLGRRQARSQQYAGGFALQSSARR